MADDPSTLSQVDPENLTKAKDLDAQLVLVMECERPLEPSQAWSLAGIRHVTIGRGSQRESEVSEQELVVRAADRWMSQNHAVLRREEGSWILEDQGSKNGMVHRGETTEQAILKDGDVFELGHTQFLFRAAVPPHRETPAELPELATHVPELADRYRELSLVARSLVPVVLLGESGTGKEVIARAIHKLSGRKGAFVAVNCGSLPEDLVETELFGHKKGAFSGATAEHPGLVRSAEGGTLFLDEIGDLPLLAQAALLRVIQEREVLPVGATRPVKVDLRVVCATHRDLDAAVAARQFRADLHARLSGFKLMLTALRHRREDLGTIARTLIRRNAPDPGAVTFTCRAARALLGYVWPMNIRELEKCLESAVTLAGATPVDLPHLPEAVRGVLARRVGDSLAQTQPVLGTGDSRRREELCTTLREHKGNIAAVARAMGKAPMQIHRWIKKFDLDLESFRKSPPRPKS